MFAADLTRDNWMKLSRDENQRSPEMNGEIYFRGIWFSDSIPMEMALLPNAGRAAYGKLDERFLTELKESTCKVGEQW